jgi:phage repressor protein C with HTH and peptisase S24 domain
VLGRAQAGDGGVLVLDGTISDQVACPGALANVENAYAVEVVGDCMSPRYEPGELVFIHPSRPVHPGSYVLLHVSDGHNEIVGMVKKYLRTTEADVIVEQLNPAQELRFPRASVAKMHLVVGSGIR